MQIYLENNGEIVLTENISRDDQNKSIVYYHGINTEHFASNFC